MFCQNVKELLSQQGVAFTERDIIQDKEALQELERYNIMTTPLTIYGDETIIGFDKDKLQALIDKSNE